MPRRLAFAVHLQHPGTGDHLVLLPGEIPPRELAELITNPDAWQLADQPDSEHAPDREADGTQPPARTPRTRKARTD
ncbi:hypothetical protein DR950_18085 [Kitasatospora xanthocidica]|uniref:Uncharacterized protein n=1 Tax=Kitasatospora xanthocidica TaxID=83382 RepID=A0A372ZU51_9ACTN|nr:hypothetical protein [Kitasatospora xanthocidica]RGD59448.1 hypothetical protein DR950_18085 [Kitasatospora xanthocidica]